MSLSPILLVVTIEAVQTAKMTNRASPRSDRGSSLIVAAFTSLTGILLEKALLAEFGNDRHLRRFQRNAAAAGHRSTVTVDWCSREDYFCLKLLINSLDFKKLPTSFVLASRMIILTVFTSAASEHRVAHPAGSTQLAMHPAVQLIVQVGWSSIVHVAA